MSNPDVTLTLMQAAEAVQAVLEADKTPILWGSPGIGKTTIIEQMIARIVNRTGEQRFSRVITLDAAALADGTVQGGVPIPDMAAGVTRWLPPDYFVNQVDDRALIFLDDIGVLQPSSLAPLLRMIQFKQVGSYKLPDGVRFALASNRETENAGAQKLTTALNNRLVHLEVVASAEEVIRYALQRNWDITVPMFLKFKEEAVSDFDKNVKAFPSPRSWEATSDLVKQFAVNPLGNVELSLICGAIGQKYGFEFNAFRDLYKSLPTAEQVFMAPATTVVPDEFDGKYAILGSLLKKVSTQNVGAFITYIDRFGIPFLVAALKDMTVMRPELNETKPFIDRASKDDLQAAMFR